MRLPHRYRNGGLVVEGLSPLAFRFISDRAVSFAGATWDPQVMPFDVGTAFFGRALLAGIVRCIGTAC